MKSIYIGVGAVTLLFLFWANPIVSIPAAADGFWYGEETAEEKVTIEAFLDPVCPDSRDSWPPLKKVVDEYASCVRLLVHTFPLPYHDNAFATSRALHITHKLNTSSTYHLLEAFFHHQEQFYGKATFNKSKAVVVDQIVDFTAKALGSSYRSAIKSGFNDTTTDHATRVAFKYGCIRGVYGTPFFFVNGFPLPDAGSALNYKGWREVIDPLVSKQEEDDEFGKANAYELESHNNIHLENGKSLHQVVQELKSTPASKLCEAIQTVIGSSLIRKPSLVGKWKEPFEAFSLFQSSLEMLFFRM